MRLATLELRLLAWLLLGWVAVMMLVWLARVAPWLLWIPASHIARRVRR